MRAIHCILIASALAIASPVAAQSLRIETEMSAAERSATGIERLTETERAQLNAWLADRAARTGAAPQGGPDVDARVAEAREAGRREALELAPALIEQIEREFAIVRILFKSERQRYRV